VEAGPEVKPELEPESIISKSIYRLGHSDTWGCNKCKSKGDKWFMIKHVCKGASKSSIVISEKSALNHIR
jgi:hypothetical protein